MNRLHMKLLLVLCVVGLLLAPMYGQKTTGLITGVVTDPSGALVANAPVVITEVTTGLTRTVTTDSQGAYVAPELQPGTYKVSVKSSNFKESVTTGVELHVASTATVNVKLEVGRANELIEVSADTIQVQTGSASVGEVIESTQVKELPLNGRSFVGLTQLAPGVSAQNGFDSKLKGLQGGVDFSVNGNAVTNNLFLVDGAPNNDVGSQRTILIYPAVESIAEFKMLRNAYGPEYGQASGSVISIITKNGTNQFHGSVFYGGRNSALAAWDYFAKQGGKKDDLKRNDFGFSFGGPIIKDKLFFFYSQEWNREINGSTHNACVPSAAELAGDFSTPSCGEPRPNIPVALQAAGNPYKLKSLDPAGVLIMSTIPAANLSTPVNGNNWLQSLPLKTNWRQESARADYQVNKSNTIIGRYTQDSWAVPASNGGFGWGDNTFPLLTSAWAQPSKSVVGKWTSIINQSTINDLSFSYSNNRINITSAGTDPSLVGKVSAVVPTLYPIGIKTNKVGIPQVQGFATGGTMMQAQNIATISPWLNGLDIYTLHDDLSKVSGRHTLKAGFFYGWNHKFEDNGPASSERPLFNVADNADAVALGQIATGNPLANLLIPNNVFPMTETSVNLVNKLTWKDYEFYAGDSFKVNSKLNLEYGVRYSLLFSPYQPHGQATNFVPSLYDPAKPASDACNGLWVVPGKNPCATANTLYGTNFSLGTAGPNKYLQDQNYHLFAPRLGIAYDPSGTGNWAIRAGLGQFYQRERVSGPYYSLSNNAPFVVGSKTIYKSISSASPGGVSCPTCSASPTGGRSPNSNVPNSWQWNLSLEHTFAKETALQMSYIGNRAIHQTTIYDVNAIDPTKTTTSCVVGGQTYNNVNNWTCAAFLSGNSQQALRPYTNDAALTYWDHTGDANYHSLQMLFKTKYKRSQLTAAYTWSHSIATVLLNNSGGGAGNQNMTLPSNPGLDRGNSQIDRPQMFVANATFYFPEMKKSNGIIRNIVGGWEANVITQALSGASTTIYQPGLTEDKSRTVGGAGGWLNAQYGSGFTTVMRPLTTGISCSEGAEGPQLYNVNAFTMVGQQIGTLNSKMEGRGYCRGPRQINTDFSIDKNWKLTEKIGLQFRLDAFDLFNHPNFNGNTNNGTPISSVNCGTAVGGLYQPCSPSNNVITAETKNSTFGNAASTTTRSGRQFQYGLKVTF